MIRWIRYKHRIPSPLPPAGTLTVGQVRQRYGVSLWVVHYWIERGIISAVHRERNTPHMPSQSTPTLIDFCENGSRIRVIWIGHP